MADVETHETPAVVEPATSTETPAVEAPTSDAPEMAILSKDPVVVTSDLENAEPVVVDPSTEAPAPAETAAPAETTPESAAASPEKKEGSSLLGFLKKHVPTPRPSKRSPWPLLQRLRTPRRLKLLPPWLQLLLKKRSLLRGIMSISRHMVDSLGTLPLDQIF